MNRRRWIGVGAGVLVLSANVAVWYAKQEPDKAPPDTRGTIRDQMEASWSDLPTVPFEEATDAIRAALADETPIQTSPDPEGYGRMVSFRTLNAQQREDLIEAIGGLVAAIAARTPHPLSTYMKDRGLKIAPGALQTRLVAAGRADEAAGVADARRRLGLLYDAKGAQTCWSALAPGATSVHVWKPISLRHVSLIHLGRSTSWAWGNEAITESLFVASPNYEQASRSSAAVLGDVRVVVEHDESLGNERSPYFLRFWLSPSDNRWRPIAAKLVRTVESAEGEAGPAIIL